MNYLISFISCGIICSISQFILEKSKLTPGHINTMLVIVGCILSGFGLYDKILDVVGTGISVTIMNFGYLLVCGASEGVKMYGIMGLFKGIMNNAGPGIAFAIFCAFTITLFFKVKH